MDIDRLWVGSIGDLVYKANDVDKYVKQLEKKNADLIRENKSLREERNTLLEIANNLSWFKKGTEHYEYAMQCLKQFNVEKGEL